MKPEHLSHSGATKFDQCPQAWAFRYIHGRHAPPTFSTGLGTFVHAVLELVMADPKEDRTLERTRQHAATVWGSPDNELLLADLDLPPEKVVEMRTTAWWMIKRWRDRIEDPMGIDVVAIEQKYKVDLGGVPFVGLVDRLDRVNGRLMVVDYKTGKPRESIQGTLYAAAVKASTGETPTTVRMVYLRQRAVDRLVSERVMTSAVNQLRATWDKINAAVDADVFPTKPGPLCAWCEHVALCPVGRKEVDTRHRNFRVRPDAPALVALGLTRHAETTV